jgi:hypothetical protein
MSDSKKAEKEEMKKRVQGVLVMLEKNDHDFSPAREFSKIGKLSLFGKVPRERLDVLGREPELVDPVRSGPISDW